MDACRIESATVSAPADFNTEREPGRQTAIFAALNKSIRAPPGFHAQFSRCEDLSVLTFPSMTLTLIGPCTEMDSP